MSDTSSQYGAIAASDGDHANTSIWKKTRAGNTSWSSSSLNTLIADDASETKAHVANEAGTPQGADSQISSPHKHHSLVDTFKIVSLQLKCEKQMGREDAMKIEFFRLGLFSGASFQLLMISIFIMFMSSYTVVASLNDLSREYFPVFRMIFYILFFWTVYGVGVFIWRRYDIPYREILELPEGHTYQMILQGSATISYIVFTMFLLFILTISGVLDICSKHVYPALALFIPLMIFLWPSDKYTQIFFGKSSQIVFTQRWNLLYQVWSILKGPFSKPSRIRNLLTDILCSMPKLFTDAQYTAQLYITFDSSAAIQEVPKTNWYAVLTLFLTILPYSLRLMQVARSHHENPDQMNLWNMLKYLLSICVTLLNTARVHSTGDTQTKLSFMWVVVASCTTAFSYYWDIVVGWGLCDTQSKNWMLRDELYFPNWVYYVCICCNFLMRLCWALNISPGQPYLAQNFILIIGCTELLRRALWIIMCIEYQAVKRIKNAELFQPNFADLQNMNLELTKK